MSVSAWKTNEEQGRSPIKTLPLRLPGQSNDERIDELRDTFYEDLAVTLCLVFLTLMQWVQWWFELPPHPIPLTVMALVAIAYVWKKGVPLKHVIRNLKLGRDGERVVAELLEPLRTKGYQIFHDIPGNGFNIDHVIIGPAGVFTIETKTRSKRRRGSGKVVYDGNVIRIEDETPSDGPLIQARAQAAWIANLLNDGRARCFAVRSVVVFPGWYIERTGHPRNEDVWVVNPLLLGDCLDYEPHILSPSLIDSAANTLALHCRRTILQEQNSR